MRRIKHISLVFTLAPILFTGCTQDKVSRIAPSKSTDGYIQSSLSVTEKSLEKKQMVSETELDKLVALVQRKLAEDKTPKPQIEIKPKSEPLLLSSIDVHNNIQEEEIPLVDPSSIEEIDSPPIEAEIIDENSDSNLEELTRLVSQDIDTNIDGASGVYSTPIVLSEEEEREEKRTQIVKMLEEIKANKISREKEIIDTAMAYLDTKYIWAANGPSAFDCSGFTKYVFGKNGFTIPRYSGNQAKVGIKVNYKELEVGDLVFFDTEKGHKKRKVNHVGIYIGNNKFIHASSAKKKVTITSFKKKKFYKQRFLWGRRIVKDNSTYASL